MKLLVSVQHWARTPKIHPQCTLHRWSPFGCRCRQDRYSDKLNGGYETYRASVSLPCIISFTGSEEMEHVRCTTQTLLKAIKKKIHDVSNIYLSLRVMHLFAQVIWTIWVDVKNIVMKISGLSEDL